MRREARRAYGCVDVPDGRETKRYEGYEQVEELPAAPPPSRTNSLSLHCTPASSILNSAHGRADGQGWHLRHALPVHPLAITISVMERHLGVGSHLSARAMTGRARRLTPPAIPALSPRALTRWSTTTAPRCAPPPLRNITATIRPSAALQHD